jgi:hypothetical protein
MRTTDENRDPGEIIFHFDVARHSIPLVHFLDTARGTQEILEAFNVSVFDRKLDFTLHVKAPEPGTLTEVFTVVFGAPAAVMGFFATDIGKAFFKGLTTLEPAQWAEKAGTSIRASLNKTKARDVSDSNVLILTVDDTLEAAFEREVTRRIDAEALATLLLSFLQLDTDQLEKIGITVEKFRGAFKGRNQIYEACIRNTEVKGLAFSRSDNFPVKRRDFPKKVTRIPDLENVVVSTPPQLCIETADIVVNSPNWKRDGRKWQAATSQHQDIAFTIDDEGFWLRVERRDTELRPSIRDNMRVQWAYPAGHAKPSNVQVLRVLSYNGKTISTPMGDQEIRSLHSAFKYVETKSPGLFD